MSHERESFPTLENDSEQGAVLKARQEGNAALLQNGSIGFAFKDQANNVVLPQLNPEGAIVVTTDAGTCKRGYGEDVNGNDVAKMVLVTIPLVAEKLYSKLSSIGSCFRDTEFEIVLIDDVGVTDTETKLGEYLCGPGQFTTKWNLDCDQFDTIGGTGVINLVLRAINLNKASKTSASISVNEIA